MDIKKCITFVIGEKKLTLVYYKHGSGIAYNNYRSDKSREDVRQQPNEAVFNR